ncbi:MAG TPA: aspartate aminotransferase family protein [Gemmataceae bacterium]|nr:aspartate aminotransferase family protein [Gemmataceae bacterium]
MTASIQHPAENTSNADREVAAKFEPKTLRTFTPSQAVLAKSAGVYHWTPEGRKLFDFSSGVLVANLGHNPSAWMQKFVGYMGWNASAWQQPGYFQALPMTAYNAVTPVEVQASKRLADLLQSRPGGKRLQQVLWAASGSEAIQKALWAAMARDRTRDMIIATRFGFHGKKGLAGAVTGSETDRERDPRVRFISFPMKECADVSMRDQAFDPAPYRQELEALKAQFGRKFAVLITEPYIGGGGSYHPHKPYLLALQQFCRENDIIFILDEVQSNFGRTGDLFAFETYGLEPDIVVLGKGLGNGVPVAAAVGSASLFGSLDYGEGSDTWSANPLCCAAVLATLDEFARGNVLESSRRSSAVIEKGLVRLKELPFVAQVRGEKGGMVWGVEMCDHAGKTGADWANAVVLACYRGEDNVGIHLLGPLAKKVVRIAPPLVITEAEVQQSMDLMYRVLSKLG